MFYYRDKTQVQMFYFLIIVVLMIFALPFIN